MMPPSTAPGSSPIHQVLLVTPRKYAVTRGQPCDLEQSQAPILDVLAPACELARLLFPCLVEVQAQLCINAYPAVVTHLHNLEIRHILP